VLSYMIDSAELLIDNVSPSESIHHVPKERNEKVPSASTLMSARTALTVVLQMKFAKIQLDHSPAAVLPGGKDRPEAAQIKTNALLELIPARQPKFAQILRDRTIATPVSLAL
jgi:hypothetical protein